MEQNPDNDMETGNYVGARSLASAQPGLTEWKRRRLGLRALNRQQKLLQYSIEGYMGTATKILSLETRGRLGTPVVPCFPLHFGTSLALSLKFLKRVPVLLSGHCLNPKA